MEHKDNHLESNIARLVRESYGPQSRLDPELHEDMLRRLRGVSDATRSRTEFPDGVLLALTGVLILMAVWLVIQISSGQSIMSSTPLVIMAAILMLNLALVPISGIVIVMRRRHAST
ncbi:hypothetical protein ACFL3X_01245 [Gemmatimonadota bacterium]